MAAATDLYTRWPNLSREEQRTIVEAIIDRMTVGAAKSRSGTTGVPHIKVLILSKAGSLHPSRRGF